MKYVYLLLGMSLLFLVIAMMLKRRDFAGKALKFGYFGGFAGLVAEFFYFRDYWRPPSLLGTATISIEDFIFGFAITALSVIVFPYVSKRVFMAADYPKHRHLYAIFFVSGVAAMLFFSVFLHINSIFVSSVVFVLCTVVMFTLRRDLIRPAIYSAVMILPILICIYIVLFDIVAPRFWDTYWLLAGTAWDVRFFGNVPLTEMIWYISWVMLASTSYPFVAGKAIVRSSSR